MYKGFLMNNNLAFIHKKKKIFQIIYSGKSISFVYRTLLPNILLYLTKYVRISKNDDELFALLLTNEIFEYW